MANLPDGVLANLDLDPRDALFEAIAQHEELVTAIVNSLGHGLAGKVSSFISGDETFSPEKLKQVVSQAYDQLSPQVQASLFQKLIAVADEADFQVLSQALKTASPTQVKIKLRDVNGFARALFNTYRAPQLYSDDKTLQPLSKAIHSFYEQSKQSTTATLSKIIYEGRSAIKAAKELKAVDLPTPIANKYVQQIQEAISSLGNTGALTPQTRKELKKIVRQYRKYIDTKLSDRAQQFNLGIKGASKKLAAAIEKATTVEAAQEAVRKWFERKAIYHEKVVARTELNRAYNLRTLESAKTIQGSIGIRVVLSDAHPRPDICDDLKGEYLFSDNPNPPIPPWHPNCLCGVKPILSKQAFIEQAREKVKASLQQQGLPEWTPGAGGLVGKKLPAGTPQPQTTEGEISLSNLVFTPAATSALSKLKKLELVKFAHKHTGQTYALLKKVPKHELAKALGMEKAAAIQYIKQWDPNISSPNIGLSAQALHVAQQAADEVVEQSDVATIADVLSSLDPSNTAHAAIWKDGTSQFKSSDLWPDSPATSVAELKDRFKKVFGIEVDVQLTSANLPYSDVEYLHGYGKELARIVSHSPYLRRWLKESRFSGVHLLLTDSDTVLASEVGDLLNDTSVWGINVKKDVQPFSIALYGNTTVLGMQGGPDTFLFGDFRDKIARFLYDRLPDQIRKAYDDFYQVLHDTEYILSLSIGASESKVTAFRHFLRAFAPMRMADFEQMPYFVRRFYKGFLGVDESTFDDDFLPGFADWVSGWAEHSDVYPHGVSILMFLPDTTPAWLLEKPPFDVPIPPPDAHGAAQVVTPPPAQAPTPPKKKPAKKKSPKQTEIKAVTIAEVDEEVALARKIGGPGGSNSGGIYQGTDGVTRYVKFYDDPEQAYTEILANHIYQELGVEAPKSGVVRLKNGQIAFYSEYMENLSGFVPRDALDENISRDFLSGFLGDVYLANNDVIGMSWDNIMLMPGGRVIRIDNGGALRFKAQGALKPDYTSILQWDYNLTQSSKYRRFFEALGIGPGNVEDIPNLTEQIVRLRHLVGTEEARKALLASVPEPYRTTFLGVLTDRWKNLSKLLQERTPEAWEKSLGLTVGPDGKIVSLTRAAGESARKAALAKARQEIARQLSDVPPLPSVFDLEPDEHLVQIYRAIRPQRRHAAIHVAVKASTGVMQADLERLGIRPAKWTFNEIISEFRKAPRNKELIQLFLDLFDWNEYGTVSYFLEREGFEGAWTILADHFDELIDKVVEAVQETPDINAITGYLQDIASGIVHTYRTFGRYGEEIITRLDSISVAEVAQMLPGDTTSKRLTLFEKLGESLKAGVRNPEYYEEGALALFEAAKNKRFADLVWDYTSKYGLIDDYLADNPDMRASFLEWAFGSKNIEFPNPQPALESPRLRSVIKKIGEEYWDTENLRNGIKRFFGWSDEFIREFSHHELTALANLPGAEAWALYKAESREQVLQFLKDYYVPYRSTPKLEIRFKNPEHQRFFEKTRKAVRKKIEKFFDEHPDFFIKRTRSDGTTYYEMKGPASGGARRLPSEVDHFFDYALRPRTVRTATRKWQDSTWQEEASMLKWKAYKLEEFPDGVSTRTFFKRGFSQQRFERLEQAGGYVSDKDYVTLRATTQALLDVLGYYDEDLLIPMHRGTGGGTGQGFALEATNALMSPDDFTTVKDAPVAGYTIQANKTVSFGEFVVQRMVQRNEVIVPEWLMAVSNHGFKDEHEWILLGGDLQVHLKHIVSPYYGFLGPFVHKKAKEAYEFIRQYRGRR